MEADLVNLSSDLNPLALVPSDTNELIGGGLPYVTLRKKVRPNESKRLTPSGSGLSIYHCLSNADI